MSSQVTYIRYVDNCLVISKTLNDNEAIFEKLSSLHKKICFTKEEEENNQLQFLDIIITKDKTKFLTKIYRKLTFTGQYLHYQSFCSRKWKVNLIKTLYHRAYKICSKELLDLEVENIKDILSKNGYPENLIKRVIKLHHNNLNKSKVFGPEKFPAVLKLPYIGEAS